MLLFNNNNPLKNVYHRIAEEKRQTESTEAEINELKKILKSKMDEEKKIMNLLNKNEKYKSYLKGVIEKVQGSDDFSEIQDILDRHATLKSTNSDLLSQIQINTREHEAKRFSYSQFMKKSANEMLNMNNEIARLQKELEQVTISSNKVGNIDFALNHGAHEMTIEISQALLVIDNMMDRLTHHANPSLSKNPKSVKPASEEGLEVKVKQSVEKLDTIADLIVDFEDIANNWAQF